MSKLQWDKSGERFYETGVDHGVLYPSDLSGGYLNGVVWNGLTAVSEKPSGAEPSKIYADNIQYLNLISAEEFAASIEAYTYPDEFMQCDGTAEVTPGVYVGQQNRRSFAFVYRTRVGNDQNPELGYKLHLIWGAMAAPTEKGYSTVNDSPEAATFSWELTTTPTEIVGYDDLKPTASITVDSTKTPAATIKALGDILFGTEAADARIPTPGEVLDILSAATVTEVTPAVPTAAGNVITIPTTPGVEYQVAGKKVVGTYTMTKSTVVKAVPLPGYTLAEAADDDWAFTFTP